MGISRSATQKESICLWFSELILYHIAGTIHAEQTFADDPHSLGLYLWVTHIMHFNIEMILLMLNWSMQTDEYAMESTNR